MHVLMMICERSTARAYKLTACMNQYSHSQIAAEVIGIAKRIFKMEG